MIRGKKICDWNMSLGLASKVASVIVHAQEFLEELDRVKPDPDALTADRVALRSVAFDREVADWLLQLGSLAPLKRTGTDRMMKATRRRPDTGAEERSAP